MSKEGAKSVAPRDLAKRRQEAQAARARGLSNRKAFAYEAEGLASGQGLVAALDMLYSAVQRSADFADWMRRRMDARAGGEHEQQDCGAARREGCFRCRQPGLEWARTAGCTAWFGGRMARWHRSSSRYCSAWYR